MSIWTGFFWVRIWFTGINFITRNDLCGSIIGVEFINQLSEYQPFKDSASWS